MRIPRLCFSKVSSAKWRKQSNPMQRKSKFWTLMKSHPNQSLGDRSLASLRRRISKPIYETNYVVSFLPG
jgi:hypothetical protein